MSPAGDAETWPGKRVDERRRNVDADDAHRDRGRGVVADRGRQQHRQRRAEVRHRERDRHEPPAIRDHPADLFVAFGPAQLDDLRAVPPAHRVGDARDRLPGSEALAEREPVGGGAGGAFVVGKRREVRDDDVLARLGAGVLVSFRADGGIGGHVMPALAGVGGAPDVVGARAVWPFVPATALATGRANSGASAS